MDTAAHKRLPLSTRGSQLGWGLIELLVALSLVALLAVLSAPSLAGQVQTSRARSVSSLCQSYAAAAQVESVRLGVRAALLVTPEGEASMDLGGLLIDPAAGLEAGGARANQPAWRLSGEGLRVGFAPPFGAPAGGGTLRLGRSHAVVVRVASGLTVRRGF